MLPNSDERRLWTSRSDPIRRTVSRACGTLCAKCNSATSFVCCRYLLPMGAADAVDKY